MSGIPVEGILNDQGLLWMTGAKLHDGQLDGCGFTNIRDKEHWAVRSSAEISCQMSPAGLHWLGLAMFQASHRTRTETFDLSKLSQQPQRYAQALAGFQPEESFCAAKEFGCMDLRREFQA